jgi:pimeloyl-ACP methyl ester carboxylesterase
METRTQNLYVRTYGQGERILLIHGSNIGDPETLWSQQYELASRYQLIIPDRRGYGLSPQRQIGEGYEDDVLDIVSLIGSGGHLVGHSYGGLLAMVVSARYPRLVKSLTVIEPPAFNLTIEQPDVAQVVAMLKSVYRTATTPEAFLAGFLRAMDIDVIEPLILSPQHRKSIIATMEETAPWDIALDVNTLRAHTYPKLVVSGNWHPALIATADMLVRCLHADQLIIQNVGHEIQKVGKAFNDRLERLISLAHDRY